MRMQTLRSFGEGRTCGEAIDTHTHPIRRGSGHGTSEGWFVVTVGDPSRASESHWAVVTGSRTGHRYYLLYDKICREDIVVHGLLGGLARGTGLEDMPT